MKILACFDGSSASESALAQVSKIARDGDDVLLFSVVEPPRSQGRMRGPLRYVVAMATLPSAQPVVLQRDEEPLLETKSQALDRELSTRSDYLKSLEYRAARGPTYDCEVVEHDDAAAAIIKRGLALQPDLIVMATHGSTGLVHILFGDVAEEVVRSGVAPVLLVHPDGVRRARQAARP